ncbi:fumarylacetoacetate hydrolase family protein [Cytobacillus kochii]|uniref:fumarylacetoacetate hydrolase family protein n=1 Tax=Cytobacillus kochii TaxID=859143 RepID=UPI002E250654|nr:fumarylacetoacetate hydrolase family protein [Cytobacillus kochii]
MKLVSYLENEEEIRVGVILNNQIVDLTSEFNSIHSIIQNGEHGLSHIQDYLDSSKLKTILEVKDFLPPIVEVKRNIICIGWNYLAHFEERFNKNIELPSKPTVFTKATGTIAGPYEALDIPAEYTTKLDYEAELAVVIGKKGRNITEDGAMDYVFGYMCANDISARDIQQTHGGQWFMGKSLDNSCPIGPYIVTKDEINDIQNVKIECKVNDNVVQSSNTNLMIFPLKKIIAEVSKGMTLMPGDIILTGTPSGIGAKRNPPLFLHSGDVVEVSVEGMGKIKNKIVR